jgi:1,4-alpha-glucan branching enzyme
MTSSPTLVGGNVTPGQLDLYLFNEGRHRQLWNLLGAHVIDPDDPAQGVRFTVWAPNARMVYAVGDWNQWGDGTPMTPVESSGIWMGVCAEARVGDAYKFAVVEGSGRTVLKADPMARQSQCPPENSSVVAGPSEHQWNDRDWMQARTNKPSAPLRIYEVHLGSWRCRK